MFQAKQVEEEYAKLLKAEDKPIREKATVQSHLKWQKAVNDLSLAEGLLKISTDEKVKEVLGYPKDKTFYDWTIVSSYYSIFHATQALLGMKKIKIGNRQHYATLIAFAKNFIINNELAEELFFIYEDAEKKAKELLDIIEEEKRKRGIFQYHRLSRNNLEPAQKSVENAKTCQKPPIIDGWRACSIANQNNVVFEHAQNFPSSVCEFTPPVRDWMENSDIFRSSTRGFKEI